MTDPDWLRKIDHCLYGIQRQDAASLKALYELTAARLLGLITRIVNNRDDAEDILQDVFVKVWQQAKQYSGTGTAWGWLCVLARHRAIDRTRGVKNRNHDSIDELPNILEQFIDEHDPSHQHWLGQCLKQLKPQARNAILLSYLNGYTHSELSEELAAPLGTIKAWIRRGLQELKQCLTA